MAEERAQRHLAAILAADVVGYSRLMGLDEAGTFERLRAHRTELFEPKIGEHHGRIFKLMGDGLLAEFASVVDAVACAVTLQRGMAERNAGLPDDRRIDVRIGINLGDVIIDGEDRHGDGVNIAARLQGLAERGGILISGTAYDQVKAKVPVGYAYLGEQTVKNIADPVRVYRVLLDPATAGKIVDAAYKSRARLLVFGMGGALLIAAVAVLQYWQTLRTPERLSVAVLPFENVSSDPEEGYFADGITDDLIKDLAKLSGLTVIARNSVAIYKDRPVVLQDVARDLGVRYIVEGSVRRAGGRIRVSAELIEATTGALVWSDQFDRDASGVFTVQKEIIRSISEKLEIQPTASEQERLAAPPTTNLEAYDYFLRGEQEAKGGTRLRLREALALYAKATTLDPSFADAYAADARTSVYVWRQDFDDVLPGPVARKRAYEKAGRALELNPESSLPFAVLAVLQVVDRRYDEALASARRAVALGPSDAEAYIAQGLVYSFDGRYSEAIVAIETALRLNPNLSSSDREVAGLAFLLHGDYRRAIEVLERARTETPDVVDPHLLLAAAYVGAGRVNEARAAAAEAHRLTPNVSIELNRITYASLRNGRDLERILDAMHKAGIPEWPFAFQGDERDRLKGVDIVDLALGRTWRGRTGAGEPALFQIGRDGKTAFRTPTQIVTGNAFIDRDLLCEQSENVLWGRPRCGPVYRRSHESGEPSYTYVNASGVLHFSPIE
ncbi:MAG TPA: tetratricopeptide repeat protein [Alphaproteobacteria bacterium]|nr:tetratricopeptide repeat protein [Alphaproteobacteria bacterium]